MIKHRRDSYLARFSTTSDQIPVTVPALTIIDISVRLTDGQLDRAISEADILRLVTPKQLRDVAAALPHVPGAARIRNHLDRRTFRLTRSELEREFLPITESAGLPLPETRRTVNGYEVDFFWPALGLVVEADGWTFHRTPAQQARDSERDHAHLQSGLTPVRFSHSQIHFDPSYVESILSRVSVRLRGGG